MIIQIEGIEGITNFEEILDVNGVDVIFLGPYDLSQSLGIPGQVRHPKVINAMEAVINMARRRGKVIGTFVETPEDFKMWKEMGLLFLAYKVDVGIFMDACININYRLRG